MSYDHTFLFGAVRVFVYVLLATSCAPPSFAQLPQSSETTATPIPGAGHDYLGGINETVNPANGSASIRIPVIMPPGRGITIPFSFAYDSSGRGYLSSPGAEGNSFQWLPISTVASLNGWSNSVPIASATEQTWSTTPEGAPKPTSCHAMINFAFQDARGNRHNLDLTNFSFANNPNGACMTDNWDWPYYFTAAVVTQGGEGPILATIPANWTTTPAVTVTDGDGTVFSFPSVCCSTGVLPSSVTDRYGNTITINSTFGGSGYTSLSYVDTTGRTVLQDSGFAVSPETVTIAGLGAAYTENWSSFSTTGYTVPITTLWNVCSNPQAHAGSFTELSSLTLPNGQSYSFAYDSTYATLNKITYPSGGYVRYVWGINAQAAIASDLSCTMLYGVPAITDRYVSFDGTHEVQHQTFAYSTTWNYPQSGQWVSKQTTVTTYDLVRGTNFQTVYTYGPGPADDPPNSGPPNTSVPVEGSIAYHDTNGSLLETVGKTWLNARLLTSQTNTFANNQVSKTAWNYDSNEMQIEQDDYDFGSGAPGSLLKKTVTTYAPNSAMLAQHVIDKPAKVQTYDSTGTTLAAETDFTYDSPTGTVTSGIVQHGTGCNCGNLTAEAHWLNSSGTTLTTTYTNDDTGQRLSMTGPRGSITTTSYSYADSYSSGTPPGPTNAYLTQVTYPNTGVAHIEKFSYAYASGEVTSSTDQNNLVTNYKYVDNLARLTETDLPDGGVVSVAYNDSPYNPSTPSPSVTTTKKINSSTNLVTVSAMDGMGHVLNNLVTSDPQGTIHTDTAYDGLGRVYTVSNPYRTGDPTTSSGTTTYGYDALSRKTSVTYPDNSVLTTAYCAGSTLVTDPVGKWRRSRVDGLGRLVEVDEPNAIGATVASTGCPGTGEPIWATSYTVNTLGNLKQVVQNGSHTRTFTHDFLSRLLTPSNPEVGTITYQYDSDTNCSGSNSFAGLLVSKTDARSIRTCAQYDALNRQTVLNYSNGDPTISTTYDQSTCLGLSACQNIGHTTSTTDSAGSESWAYQTDSANSRSVHVNQRTTNSSPSNITKTAYYYLDLAGNPTAIVYPTGRVVAYTYDGADRASSASDYVNGNLYVSAQASPPAGCSSAGVCYTPQGTEYSAAIGKTSTFNGINLSETYNNRLQPLEVTASSSAGNAFDITYSFVDPSTSKNAGHVYGITNNLNSSRTQAFTYDQVNRIVTAGTTATSGTYCFGYQYNYDAWGNLLAQAGWSPNYNGCSEQTMGAVTADGNNHISGFSYDASGNTQNDGTIAYTYDAESQIKTAAGVTYSYDGSGRRVSKSSGKLYWYGSGGEILAETDASGNTLNEYIFFGGKRVAVLPAGGSAEFYVEDLLGSSRVMTTNNGTLCYDADFDPFGGEHAYTSTCSQNYKFEGKERDTETGNDDFGARYYSSRFGRWLSADWSSVPVPVPYANLTNPQTLNLYSMVADDPETSADLDGHEASGGAKSTRCGVEGYDCSQAQREELKTDKTKLAQDQQQAAAAKQQAQNPFNPTVTYDKNLSAKDLAADQSKVGAAIGVINANWSKLSDREKATVGNIKSIDVSGSAQRSYVQESTGKLTLTQDYVSKSSKAWLASAIGHDGEHVALFNSGGIGASRGLPAEVKTMQFQLQVGTKFGLSATETKYLQGLIQNPSQLQQYINTPP